MKRWSERSPITSYDIVVSFLLYRDGSTVASVLAFQIKHRFEWMSDIAYYIADKQVALRSGSVFIIGPV